MQRKTQLLAAIALTFGLSAQADALSIFANFNDVAAGGKVFGSVDQVSHALSGGQMQFKVLANSPDPLPLDGNVLYGWSIEPLEPVHHNHDYQWEIISLSHAASNIGGIGETRANFLRKLYKSVAPDFTQVLSAETALALQIATWEIVSEDAPGAFDLYSGNTWFKKPSPKSALALAQGWLDDVINDGKPGPMLDNLYVLRGVDTQDMLVQINFPTSAQSSLISSAVPVAPSWMLVLAGLLLLPRLRRS